MLYPWNFCYFVLYPRLRIIIRKYIINRNNGKLYVECPPLWYSRVTVINHGRIKHLDTTWFRFDPWKRKRGKEANEQKKNSRFHNYTPFVKVPHTRFLLDSRESDDPRNRMTPIFDTSNPPFPILPPPPFFILKKRYVRDSKRFWSESPEGSVGHLDHGKTSNPHPPSNSDSRVDSCFLNSRLKRVER